MDFLTPAQRSEQMARIRSRDTGPEMVVRRLIHRLGYRYRLHDRRLPGSPDLVFAARRKVIFVHGCFWHQHDDQACMRAKMPASRPEFWIPKLQGNRQRDRAQLILLNELGWQSLVVWQCQVAKASALEATIVEFLR